MLENKYEKISRVLLKLIWATYIVGVITYFYFLFSGYFLDNFPIVLRVLGIIGVTLGVQIIIYGLLVN